MPATARTRERPVPRGALARFLVLVLLAGSIAGCVGADAEEDGETPDSDGVRGDFDPGTVPGDEDEDEAPVEPSANPDPRLNVEAPWHEGDWWYYTSNRSQWVRMSVDDIVNVNGSTYYVLTREEGRLDRGKIGVVTQYVTQDFRVVNQSSAVADSTYDPPHPGPRFLPGRGEFTYNETGRSNLESGRQEWEALRTLRVGEARSLHEFRVPAGVVNASHFRVSLRIDVDWEEEPIFRYSERWYSPDLRNDAQFIVHALTENVEAFKLVSAHVGGVRYGSHGHPDDGEEEDGDNEEGGDAPS